jgi:Na+-driven multidrug efflux pump
MDILGIEFENATQAVLKSLLFTGAFILLFYLVFLVLSKVIYRKSNIIKDLSLILTIMWSLVILLVFFNILFFFIIRYNGLDNFEWNTWTTYLGLIHLIILFVILGVSFYSLHYWFNKKIKTF